MNKRTILNLFWLLLIIIGIGLSLASFYQDAQVARKDSFKAGLKQRPGFSAEKASAEKTLEKQKIAQKPAVGALAKVFPKLAGLKARKNYLILFQNSHELRGTGGYIGSFAVLTLKRGQIKEFRFHDTSNFDYRNNNKGGVKKTPEPFQKYLDIYSWGLRDANWNPHFPKTAKRVVNFYNKLGGKRTIDGVVAITPNVLKRALNITGPIKVEGEDEFRAENVVDRIQYRVEKGFLDKEGARERRKEIMKELAEKIIEKTKSWNPLQYPKLLNAGRQAAVRKEVQVYFKDENLQNFFLKQGWAGAVRSTKNDFLMAIDTNLGALKTDRVMERSITYELDLSRAEKRPRGRLELHYKNNGQQKDWRTTDYKSYLRVYLPRGTKLMGTKGLSSKAKKFSGAGKTIFEGWVKVPLREKRTIVFEYLLPKRIDQKNYSLTLQKQAGIDSLPVKLKYHLPNKNLERRLNLSEDLKISF